MQRNGHKAKGKPFDPEGLWRLALHYVGRYATTEAKLRQYLRRKVAERGWASDGMPDFDAIVGRCVELGYVDDRGFAENKVRALGHRGYGARRVAVALQRAGVDREMAASVMPDDEAALAAALTYARRRRIGAFGAGGADPITRQKQFAAMVRAGHSFELARKFVSAEPGDPGYPDAV